MKRRRSGFTMIEVLVVIGIILVLVGLLYVGMKYVGAGPQAQATKVTLANLQNMLAELEIKSKLDTSPLPFYPTPPGTITAPGSVIDSNPAQRHGDAVLRTQRVMARILQVPENRTAIQKLPPEQLMTVLWQPGSATVPVDYFAGDHVGYVVAGAMNYYLCTTSYTANGSTPTPDAAHWTTDTRPVPVLLDAWRNPIIFVPAGGLSNVGLDARRDTVTPPNPPALLPQTVASLGVVPDGTPAPAGSRPFFASAGPDGLFSYIHDDGGTPGPTDDLWTAGGDDNVYSFRN